MPYVSEREGIQERTEKAELKAMSQTLTQYRQVLGLASCCSSAVSTVTSLPSLSSHKGRNQKSTGQLIM